MSGWGHERRFKHKSRNSAFPPIPDISPSHRLASFQSEARHLRAARLLAVLQAILEPELGHELQRASGAGEISPLPQPRAGDLFAPFYAAAFATG
jgi:hypothetical protein